MVKIKILIASLLILGACAGRESSPPFGYSPVAEATPTDKAFMCATYISQVQTARLYNRDKTNPESVREENLQKILNNMPLIFKVCPRDQLVPFMESYK